MAHCRCKNQEFYTPDRSLKNQSVTPGKNPPQTRPIAARDHQVCPTAINQKPSFRLNSRFRRSPPSRARLPLYMQWVSALTGKAWKEVPKEFDGRAHARHPVVTARPVERLLGGSPAAARTAINQLPNAGILTERTGKMRYRIFQAREVLAITKIQAAAWRRALVPVEWQPLPYRVAKMQSKTCRIRQIHDRSRPIEFSFWV